MDTAYRRPVVGDAEAIPIIPDLPSEISGMGAAKNIPENLAGTGAEDGAGRSIEHDRMLH